MPKVKKGNDQHLINQHIFGLLFPTIQAVVIYLRYAVIGTFLLVAVAMYEFILVIDLAAWGMVL